MKIILLIASALLGGCWGFTCNSNAIGTGSTCFTAQSKALRQCNSGDHCDFGTGQNPFTDLVHNPGDKLCVADVKTRLHNGKSCSSADECLSKSCSTTCQAGSIATGSVCTYDQECSSQKCVNSRCVQTVALNSICQDPQKFCQYSLNCIQSTVSGVGQICITLLSGDTCSADSQCAPGLYCDTTCKAKLADAATGCGGNNNRCASGICSTSACIAATQTGQNCQNDAQCGASSFCNSISSCEPKRYIAAACTVAKECVSNVCTGQKCAAQTGNAIGAGCSADGDCAGGVKCATPTKARICKRFNTRGTACTAESDCGPGHTCSNSLCKRIYTDSGYASPPTKSFECANGHVHSGACVTVTVSDGGTALAYPYKCTSNCVYANSAQATILCSATNGYCPIVEGMAEYKTYQTALSQFYSLTDVQNFANLTPSNFRQINPFLLIADFNGASTAILTALQNLQKLYFQITHTSLLESHCSTTLGSGCASQIPNYSSSYSIACQTPQATYFTCGAAPNSVPSGTCGITSYGLNTPFQVAIVNSNLSHNKCPLLSNSNTLTPSRTSQNVIQSLILPPDITCPNNKPCAGQKCSTVQNDSDETEVCSEGRCKNAAGLLCKTGALGLYNECTSQGDCGNSFFCDFPDNTCKLANQGLSNECSSNSNCNAAQYCDSTTHKCTPRKGSGGPCSKSEECPTNQYCKGQQCSSKENNNTNCPDHSACTSGYCATQCTAQSADGTTCTVNEQCTSSLCSKQCNASANPQSCGTDENCLPDYYCNANSCAQRIAINQGCVPSQQNCQRGLICTNGNCATYTSNCQSNFNCRAGQYCNSNSCVPLKAEDAACTLTSECGTNMVCQGSKCKVKSPEGGTCLTNANCVSNSCGATLKCSPLPSVGSHCPGSKCATGNYCASPNNVCAALKTTLATCSANNQCQANHFCHQTIKYCSTKITTGNACVVNTSNYHEATRMCSASNQRCLTSTCKTLTGTSCSHSHECASTKYCSGSNCVNKKGASSTCASDQECENTLFCNTAVTPHVCKSRIANDEVCSSDNECALTSNCASSTFAHCVLSRAGDVCKRESECAYHMNCFGTPTCLNDLPVGNSCTTDEPCQAGLLCQVNKCAQIVSVAAGQTTLKDEFCISGMRASSSNTCYEFTVKDKSTTNTLTYPYECTVGQKCSYQSSHASTVERDCQALSPSRTHGTCPIIKGVREYSLYRQSVYPLVRLATNCTKTLQTNPQMSAALARCTNATAAQKAKAWGAYFTIKYPNFLHNSTFTSCKDAIVSTDSLVTSFGSVPDFTVQNYLKLNTSTAIDGSTSLFHVQGVFAGFPDNFGTNLAEAQNFLARIQELVQHQSSKFGDVKATIGAKLGASFGSVTSSSEFKALIDANEIFIKQDSNGAAHTIDNYSNMLTGKSTLSQSQVKVDKTIDSLNAKAIISAAAISDLKNKGASSINFQAVKASPKGSFTQHLTLVLNAYNAGESQVSVTDLSNDVELEFTNTNAVSTTLEVRVGVFDYNSNSWSPLTTEYTNGVYKARTSHFSTFGLFLYDPPVPQDRSDLYVIALVAVMVGIGVGVLVLIHFLFEKKMNKTSDHYLIELDKQIRHSRNQNVEDFLKNDSNIINVEDIDHHIHRDGSNQDLQLPQVQTSEPRTLLPYITTVFRHLNLLSKYNFCKFWFYNFLYLSPFLSSCFRYHPNVPRKCEISIDIGRVLFTYCIGIILGYEVSPQSDVYLYSILIGLFMMCPIITGLFQSLITIKMRTESLSINKITQYMLVKLPSNKELGIVRPRNIEELEELKIQGYDWAPRKFNMTMFGLVTTMYICAFLGAFGLAMYFAKLALQKNVTGFWNGIEGGTLAVLVGFAFCQLSILWCSFMKGVVFRARKRGGCGRVLETILVDLRTSMIFNDYRSLHLKFLKKEENP